MRFGPNGGMSLLLCITLEREQPHDEIQEDIAQRSKDRPAWIVLEQVACVSIDYWGKVPPAPTSISVTHPPPSFYPRFLTSPHVLANSLFKGQPHHSQNKTISNFTTTAAQHGWWLATSRQEEYQEKRGVHLKFQCAMCTIYAQSSSLSVTFSACRTISNNHWSNGTCTEHWAGQSQSWPMSNWDGRGARCPLEESSSSSSRSAAPARGGPESPSSTKFSHHSTHLQTLPPSQQLWVLLTAQWCNSTIESKQTVQLLFQCESPKKVSRKPFTIP